MAISTRRNLRPISVSTEALKKVVAASHRRGRPREVEFDYHGLSNDQWRSVLESFCATTRFAVTGATFEEDSNCFHCLVEALRQGYAPKRIAVKVDNQTTAAKMEQLV